MKKTSTNNKIIMVGGFHETIEIAQMLKLNIVGIIDNNQKGMVRGYKVLGTDQDAQRIYKKYKDIPLVISIDSPLARKKVARLYQQAGFKFCSLISPKAIVSPSAQIGQGVVIQNAANISAASVIGDFAKINTAATVTHDCSVGEFSTIAPNAVVLGYAQIGRDCYVGANAVVLPHKKIADSVMIGAGAVVTKDIPQGMTVVGVPAQPYSK